MTTETVKAIVEAGGAIGLEIRAYPDYSGRGMFGATTAAVVVGSFGTFAAAVGQAAVDLAFHPDGDPDELIEDVANLRTDSLGQELILY